MPEPAGTPAQGLVVVDKPAGMTSHDVVARVRRTLGTRKVGHAGTLDPMATGVLVVGVGRATRLLGHLAGADKSYLATVRLGVSTTTDDAEGEVVEVRPAAGVTAPDVVRQVALLTGDLDQVPSTVSAVKVAGRRAYARARDGEQVELEPRRVHVSQLAVKGIRRPEPDLLDVDVTVTCSSGTYVRALARDLGAALDVGGHLTALRRTRVGRFDLSDARTLDQLVADPVTTPTAVAVARAFPRRDVDAAAAEAVRHGRPLPLAGESGPTGVFGPGGEALALMAPRDGALRALVVLVG